MPVAASEILDFLERQETFTIDRRVITSPIFSVLRKNLRQIALNLHDSDCAEAAEISGRIRVLLSEWLTVPVQFDQSIATSIRDLFGNVGTIQPRWGGDIQRLY